ncbi:Protein of unknown function [Pyronema omphalodes CBS 100304]|uniref:Uncharacterized protein n=1 Tax=Pyronema omphalodes (strain CBS 100304) TaxID=1076935 RepID=U4LBK9_PYROM|nr:Protein of unknown function [Pyronema omphalodes CBS 100304]
MVPIFVVDLSIDLSTQEPSWWEETDPAKATQVPVLRQQPDKTFIGSRECGTLVSWHGSRKATRRRGLMDGDKDVHGISCEDEGDVQ